MKQSICFILLFSFFSIINHTLKAQFIWTENIPLSNQLPSNEMTDIWQDKNGFVWIGTTNGLARLDGYQIKLFQNKYHHTQQLTSNHITCIAETDSHIWAGTDHGLNLINKITLNTEECPIKELDEKEKYYIEELKTLVPYGYNVKDGGQNTSRKENPIYAYNLDGTFYKKYFNQNGARKDFNVNGSDLTKCLDGKVHYIKGKIWKREYRDKLEPVLSGKNGAKPVLQIDPETNQIINIYDSASAAARALGLSRPTGISKCCNGNSKISAGYKWQFLQSSTTKDH